MSQTFPEAKQVKELGLENATDNHIWEYAKSNGFTIITFDADFYDLVTLYGHPPKVVWLRIGNTSTQNLRNVISRHSELIRQFILNTDFKDIGCLEIDN